MAKNKPSAVIQLLDLVWANANTSTSHSWERLNHAMQDALRLAVTSGMPFAPDDFTHIVNNYRSVYWLDGERFYASAVATDNKSAFLAYERCTSRDPFIADNVRSGTVDSGNHLGYVHRDRSRLAFGFEFDYAGYRPRVTSFGDNKLTAVVSEREYGHRAKVLKRFTITRDDLIRDRAERKERAEMFAEASKWPRETQRHLTTRLGNWDQWSRGPIVKLRKAFTKIKRTL